MTALADAFNVTVIVDPDGIASLTVAVMLIVAPALYVPSAVEEVNEVTVGGTAIVSVVDAAAAKAGPVDVPFDCRTAAFAASCGRTVPSVVQVGVTV